MSRNEKMEFSGHAVEVQPDLLRFNEDSLTTYIQSEGGYYDNYGAYLALAEKNLQNKELMAEKLYSERFDEAKEGGCTEKQAEARAKSDSVVIKMKEDVIDARYIVNRLKMHLKAWDKNHDNAQSLGHTLRRAMDKLNGDIMTKYYEHGVSRETPELDKKVSEEVEKGGFETELSAANLF